MYLFNDPVDMKHLILVKGLPRETIETKLKEEGINYWIPEYSSIKVSFFKNCSIYIRPHDQKMGSRIITLLGFPDYSRTGSYHYYAKYKLSKDFDISQLGGKITFEKGLLIETTQIHF